MEFFPLSQFVHSLRPARRRMFLLLATALLILPACGQKGPLFLSDPAAPGKPPPAGAAAAAPDKSPEKK